MQDKQQQQICVFGLGQSGLSAARYLDRIKQPFMVIDSRQNPPGKMELHSLTYCQSSYLGEIPLQQLLASSLIILSPGISPAIPEIVEARKAGIEVVGDVELFARATTKKIVAITGSNGKSTVTDLTHRLLRAAGVNAEIGGNFGVPVLDYLPQDKPDVYVLELSSFQLDTTRSLKATVAVVLNISEDHMDRYQNFNEYCQSKLSIYRGAEKRLANADDSLTFKGIRSPLELFSVHDQSAKYHLKIDDAEASLVCDGTVIVSTNQLKLSGSHNWGNALASLAILDQLEIEISASVIELLKQYQGLAHRFQLVSRSAGIDWINDSKATNVGATQAALASVDKNIYSAVILIAGGDAKGADLSSLKAQLQQKVSHLVLIGKDAKLLAELIEPEKVSLVKDMKCAVVQAKAMIQQLVNQKTSKRQAMVLLSPACASLDMYKNFEARGQAFVEAVKECA